MHITPLAGLRFRLPCGNKNLSAIADATVRRQISQSANADAIVRRTIAYLVIAGFLGCFCFWVKNQEVGNGR
ncbi:MAG: hypothetical protein LBU34_13240 [Planctomycetaceae bacterium]|nr:hypothetical protein [Planctomycetaceae bacterium]